MYCDTQYSFIDNPRHFLTQRILESPSGIAISTNKPNEPCYPEHTWSKGDAFALILGRDAYDESSQAWAGFFAARRSVTALAFVAAWLAYAEDPRIITDSPTHHTNNHVSFRENRHDQTVLSLLAKRHGISMYYFPCLFLQNLRVPFDLK